MPKRKADPRVARLSRGDGTLYAIMVNGDVEDVARYMLRAMARARREERKAAAERADAAVRGHSVWSLTSMRWAIERAILSPGKRVKRERGTR